MTNERTDHSARNNLDRTMPTREEAAANDSADEAAVRALYQQLMDGWTRAVATRSPPSSRRTAISSASTAHT